MTAAVAGQLTLDDTSSATSGWVTSWRCGCAELAEQRPPRRRDCPAHGSGVRAEQLGAPDPVAELGPDARWGFHRWPSPGEHVTVLAGVPWGAREVDPGPWEVVEAQLVRTADGQVLSAVQLRRPGGGLGPVVGCEHVVLVAS